MRGLLVGLVGLALVVSACSPSPPVARGRGFEHVLSNHSASYARDVTATARDLSDESVNVGHTLRSPHLSAEEHLAAVDTYLKILKTMRALQERWSVVALWGDYL